MKVVLSGGGTGGHITPLVATAAALQKTKQDIELHYIGVDNPAERAMLSGAAMRRHWIISGKYRRYSGMSWWQRILDVPTWTANLVDGFKLIIGTVQSWRLLRRLRPDVVFVKGGYVGLPVGVAASWLKIPLVLHESDVKPGLTNRILAKRATKLATGLPIRYYQQWQGLPLVHVGIPLRQGLLQTKTPPKGSQPTILVVGGSGGSRLINDAVIKLLQQLTKHYRVVHVAGNRDFQLVQEAARVTNGYTRAQYQLHEFMSAQQLGAAIVASQVVVSRAGMTAIAEIAAFAKALVVVPIGLSTHQNQNAQLLEKQHAALVADEDTLPANLLTLIEQLGSSKTRRQQLGANLQGLFPAGAAEQLATLIIQSAPPGEKR